MIILVGCETATHTVDSQVSYFAYYLLLCAIKLLEINIFIINVFK